MIRQNQLEHLIYSCFNIIHQLKHVINTIAARPIFPWVTSPGRIFAEMPAVVVLVYG